MGGCLQLIRGIGRGNEEGCTDEIGLVLVFGKVGGRRRCLAMVVVGEVGVGIFLLECEGYAGAPGSARVASVCGSRLGRKSY